MVRNPVMFTVEVVATPDDGPVHPRPRHGEPAGSASRFQINLWLWFTVLFANFAEAVAEGRGKAQAATLRKAKTETVAKRLADVSDTKWQTVPGDRSCARATSCWSRRATSSRPTAR